VQEILRPFDDVLAEVVLDVGYDEADELRFEKLLRRAPKGGGIDKGPPPNLAEEIAVVYEIANRLADRVPA
jgi:hypothetical protein